MNEKQQFFENTYSCLSGSFLNVSENEVRIFCYLTFQNALLHVKRICVKQISTLCIKLTGHKFLFVYVIMIDVLYLYGSHMQKLSYVRKPKLLIKIETIKNISLVLISNLSFTTPLPNTVIAKAQRNLLIVILKIY